MRHKSVTFLLFLAVIASVFFLATALKTQKLFACNYYASDYHVLQAAPEKTQTHSHSHNQDENNERTQSIRELAGHGRNINIVLSKSEGTRIIENIKSQRTRTAAQLDAESERTRKNYAGSKTLCRQSELASGIHKSNITEIHQDIQQRK